MAGQDSTATASLLSPAGPTKGHKATLTTLLARDDLDAATNSTPVELPSAPPLSHDTFAGEQFDPSEFLLERRHTGLDELRSEVSDPQPDSDSGLGRAGVTSWT